MGLSHLFKTRFFCLTLRHQNAVTWTYDQHAWFLFIYIDITPPLCNYILELRVSVLFFNLGAFSLAGCLLPFYSQTKSCFSALLFFSKYVMRVALYLAYWPPVWLPRRLSHLSGSRTVPWPLVLRLLATTELLLY